MDGDETSAMASLPSAEFQHPSVTASQSIEFQPQRPASEGSVGSVSSIKGGLRPSNSKGPLELLRDELLSGPTPAAARWPFAMANQSGPSKPRSRQRSMGGMQGDMPTVFGQQGIARQGSADVSSIASMPDSTADTHLTPKSYANLVSDLDTPSTSYTGQSQRVLYTDMDDDYVTNASPLTWTPLRQRHGSLPASASSQQQQQQQAAAGLTPSSTHQSTFSGPDSSPIFFDVRVPTAIRGSSAAGAHRTVSGEHARSLSFAHDGGYSSDDEVGSHTVRTLAHGSGAGAPSTGEPKAHSPSLVMNPLFDYGALASDQAGHVQSSQDGVCSEAQAGLQGQEQLEHNAVMPGMAASPASHGTSSDVSFQHGLEDEQLRRSTGSRKGSALGILMSGVRPSWLQGSRGSIAEFGSCRSSMSVEALAAIPTAPKAERTQSWAQAIQPEPPSERSTLSPEASVPSLTAPGPPLAIQHLLAMYPTAVGGVAMQAEAAEASAFMAAQSSTHAQAGASNTSAALVSASLYGEAVAALMAGGFGDTDARAKSAGSFPSLLAAGDLDTRPGKAPAPTLAELLQQVLMESPRSTGEETEAEAAEAVAAPGEPLARGFAGLNAYALDSGPMGAAAADSSWQDSVADASGCQGTSSPQHQPTMSDSTSAALPSISRPSDLTAWSLEQLEQEASVLSTMLTESAGQSLHGSLAGSRRGSKNGSRCGSVGPSAIAAGIGLGHALSAGSLLEQAAVQGLLFAQQAQVLMHSGTHGQAGMQQDTELTQAKASNSPDASAGASPLAPTTQQNWDASRDLSPTPGNVQLPDAPSPPADSTMLSLLHSHLMGDMDEHACPIKLHGSLIPDDSPVRDESPAADSVVPIEELLAMASATQLAGDSLACSVSLASNLSADSESAAKRLKHLALAYLESSAQRGRGGAYGMEMVSEDIPEGPTCGYATLDSGDAVGYVSNGQGEQDQPQSPKHVMLQSAGVLWSPGSPTPAFVRPAHALDRPTGHLPPKHVLEDTGGRSMAPSMTSILHGLEEGSAQSEVHDHGVHSMMDNQAQGATALQHEITLKMCNAFEADTSAILAAAEVHPGVGQPADEAVSTSQLLQQLQELLESSLRFSSVQEQEGGKALHAAALMQSEHAQPPGTMFSVGQPADGEVDGTASGQSLQPRELVFPGFISPAASGSIALPDLPLPKPSAQQQQQQQQQQSQHHAQQEQQQQQGMATAAEAGSDAIDWHGLFASRQSAHGSGASLSSLHASSSSPSMLQPLPSAAVEGSSAERTSLGPSYAAPTASAHARHRAAAEGRASQGVHRSSPGGSLSQRNGSETKRRRESIVPVHAGGPDQPLESVSLSGSGLVARDVMTSLFSLGAAHSSNTQIAQLVDALKRELLASSTRGTSTQAVSSAVLQQLQAMLPGQYLHLAEHSFPGNPTDVGTNTAAAGARGPKPPTSLPGTASQMPEGAGANATAALAPGSMASKVQSSRRQPGAARRPSPAPMRVSRAQPEPTMQGSSMQGVRTSTAWKSTQRTGQADGRTSGSRAHMVDGLSPAPMQGSTSRSALSTPGAAAIGTAMPFSILDQVLTPSAQGPRPSPAPGDAHNLHFTASRTAAAAGQGQLQQHSSALVQHEPIHIPRPFAWQERETRLWLGELGLRPSDGEEGAAFLDNPLRNGLLLARLAEVLMGIPVQCLTVPPRDARSARNNVIAALDTLGMLEQPWAPPADAREREEAEMLVQAMAAGPLASSRPTSRGVSPARSGMIPPNLCASVASGLQLKALGSAGRGYALRLKERQLRAGLGLVAEVEKLLQGAHDSVWGLLNYIRLAHAPTHMLGGKGVPGSMQLSADGRRLFDVRGSSPPHTRPASPPAVAAAAVSSSGTGVTGAGVSTPAPPSRRASADPRASTQRPTIHKLGPKSPYLPESDADQGHVVVQLRLSPRSMNSSKKTAHTQAEQGSKAGAQSAVGAASLLKTEGGARSAFPAWPAASPAMGPTHGSVISRSETCWPLPPEVLHSRPHWARLEALPYSMEDVGSLEASLVRWLIETGAVSRHNAAQGFTALLPMFADGTFMCWLASNLAGKPVAGAHKRPLTDAARRTNWGKAIEALRCLPGMSRRFLVFEEALVRGERPVLTGLLEDLHRACDAQPPAPSRVPAPGTGARPYLPYRVEEPFVQLLPPEQLRLNKGAAPSAGSERPMGQPVSAPQQQRQQRRPVSAPRSAAAAGAAALVTVSQQQLKHQQGSGDDQSHQAVQRQQQQRSASTAPVPAPHAAAAAGRLVLQAAQVSRPAAAQGQAAAAADSGQSGQQGVREAWAPGAMQQATAGQHVPAQALPVFTQAPPPYPLHRHEDTQHAVHTYAPEPAHAHASPSGTIADLFVSPAKLVQQHQHQPYTQLGGDAASSIRASVHAAGNREASMLSCPVAAWGVDRYLGQGA